MEIFLTSPTAIPTNAIRYGFFTRCGGTSEGPFRSLNCSTSSVDNKENVIKNRHIALSSLGVAPDSLVLRRQNHTTVVDYVTTTQESTQTADGLLTTHTNLTLGVLTADCAPVLFYSHDEYEVIGAAHIGWRGAWAGLVDEMIQSMQALGVRKESISLMIGPCIGRDSYEVSDDFPILTEDKDVFQTTKKPDRFLFDLRGYLVKKAVSFGVSEIHHCYHDTYQEESLFFSARRAYHRAEPYYGHCLSVITKTHN